MGETTGISWTDHTFNPWWGCQRVSPGCEHCYAETFAKRVGQRVWGKDAPRRFFGDAHWDEPLKWDRAAAKAGVRRRVFCASMADVFEEYGGKDVLGEQRQRLWHLIGETPNLDWQLLTKRPANIRRMVPVLWMIDGFPANVWIGVTVESDDYKWRVLELNGLPIAVRFISYEPALGPLTGHGLPAHCVNWIIAGGESGAQHRDADPQWFRDVRDLCISIGIPFHFKQWGGRIAKSNGCELDGQEWKQFPVGGQTGRP